MPTPESELFLAKKPKVPPTFTGVDFNDYQAVVDARDAIIREQWVKRMMARLVREELGKWNIKLQLIDGCDAEIFQEELDPKPKTPTDLRFL